MSYQGSLDQHTGGKCHWTGIAAADRIARSARFAAGGPAGAAGGQPLAAGAEVVALGVAVGGRPAVVGALGPAVRVAVNGRLVGTTAGVRPVLRAAVGKGAAARAGPAAGRAGRRVDRVGRIAVSLALRKLPKSSKFGGCHLFFSDLSPTTGKIGECGRPYVAGVSGRKTPTRPTDPQDTAFVVAARKALGVDDGKSSPYARPLASMMANLPLTQGPWRR